ncbi:MAG: Asp23/Gls24 family envelope stress response protein [Oscillospiraceae bacterium]|nr:Asp23/Gls24 family envelope stress response protein [Oscillospiraceae bacterium]
MSENYITLPQSDGSVNISEEVVAIISAAAISEVEGVAGLSNTAGSDIQDFIGKRSVSKGIKIDFADSAITIDALIMLHYGSGIAAVAAKVQEAVVSAVEAMTGIRPTVNVHITGVVFDK